MALIRSTLASHSAADVAKSRAYARRLKVYPLSEITNPPETVFVDAKDKVFDSTIRYDQSFFANLDRVVQEEPWIDRDRIMIDQLKSIGIEKGKPFHPNATQTTALSAGVADAKSVLDATYDAGFPAFFADTHWTYLIPPALIKGIQTGFTQPDAYPVDDRGLIYTYLFISVKRPGAAQFYVLSIKDKNGNNFGGNITYHLRIPPNVPIKQYWSLTAYDRETHGLIRNVARASQASNNSELQENPDGSFDLYIGPKAPRGMETNWIPTDPARDFELIFRFYGPTANLFNKSWKLPDLEKASAN